MEVTLDAFLLADAAQVQGGKLSMLGGGWDRIQVQNFPASHGPTSVAIVFRVSWNDANQPIPIKLYFQDQDGNNLPDAPMLEATFTTGRPPDLAQGSDILSPVAFNLPAIPFSKAGTYRLVLEIAGDVKARRPFQVMKAR